MLYLPTEISHRLDLGLEPSITAVAEVQDCSPISPRRIHRLNIGGTVYELRQPATVILVPDAEGGWEYHVSGFGRDFVGSGPSLVTARRDWEDQVHESMQTFLGMQAFEFSADDKRRWELLRSVIDVVSYLNLKPIVSREVARVTQARPLPRQITWFNGQTTRVDLREMPPEFARLRLGQYFEATTERDRISGDLLQVTEVRPIRNPQMTEIEIGEFFSSLHTTANLNSSIPGGSS